MEKLRTHKEVMESLKQENTKYKMIIEASEKSIELVKKIIKAREEKGWTQRDLAKNSGLQQSAIARFETLKGSPNINTLMRITNALELNLQPVKKEETVKSIYGTMVYVKVNQNNLQKTKDIKWKQSKGAEVYAIS